MRSEPSPTRSRSRGQRTATGPMPVMISRSGRCPWRTSRWWPPAVSLSAWQLSKAATSASTACASSTQAPLRKTSVSESAKLPGWENRKTLVLVTAYHSFSGEVEASNTPTIRRLIPSCRHQLSPIAHVHKPKMDLVDFALQRRHDRGHGFLAEKYIVHSPVENLARKPPLYSKILPAGLIFEINEFPQRAVAEVGHELF